MKLALFFISAFVTAVSASNVLDLDQSNFDKVVGKGKPALVELCVTFVIECNLPLLIFFYIALLRGGTRSYFFSMLLNNLDDLI